MVHIRHMLYDLIDDTLQRIKIRFCIIQHFSRFFSLLRKKLPFARPRVARNRATFAQNAVLYAAFFFRCQNV